MDVYVDDDLVARILHGEDYSHLLENISEGFHTIKFCSAEKPSVKGEDIVELTGDRTYKCTIYAFSDRISIDDLEIEENVEKAFIPVPDAYGRILSDVEQELKEAGFVNITSKAENDSIWSSGNWIVLSQNVEPGSTADKNTPIVLTCKKTEEYLDGYIHDASIPEVQSKAEELDFSFSYRNDVLKKNMDTRIAGMSDEEKKNWRVNSIDPKSGSREAVIGLLYHGKREVPNVVGLSLAEAERILSDADFSSVDFASNNGDGVWLHDNWEVLYQSVSPGGSHKASENIHLIVQSYESIKENGKDAISLPDASESTEKQQTEEGEGASDPKADPEHEAQSQSEADKSPESMTETLDESREEEKNEEISGGQDNSLEDRPEADSETVETSQSEADLLKEAQDERKTEEEADTGADQLADLFSDLTQEPEVLSDEEEIRPPFVQVQRGDTGNAVKAVQERLIETGYYSFPADGKFGSKTESAVAEFQKANGIEPSGIVDEITHNKLFSEVFIFEIESDANNFSEENVKRAAVVALTNSMADDDFASDRSSYDPSKFHSYADTSGFHFNINYEGDYSWPDHNICHIENMQLRNDVYRTVLDAEMDVIYDGYNYCVSNVTALYYRPEYEDVTDIGAEYFRNPSSAPYMTVSPDLIKEDRQEGSRMQNESDAAYSYLDDTIFDDKWNRWYNSLTDFWDGSPVALEELVKKVLKDEKSYKYIDSEEIIVSNEGICAMLDVALQKDGSSVRTEIGDVFYTLEFTAKNLYNEKIKGKAFGLAKYRDNMMHLLSVS